MQPKLYHLGIRTRVARSMLADANETRDWRIYADVAQGLIHTARELTFTNPSVGSSRTRCTHSMPRSSTSVSPSFPGRTIGDTTPPSSSTRKWTCAGRSPRWSVEQGRLVKKLYDAGVRLLVGSDAGTPANFHTDATWHQMELLVRYGIPPMEVIRAATRFPAKDLGMDDKLGTIEPGKLADIIIVDGNPLQNMTDLKHVVYVIKDGVQYKGPATGAVAGFATHQ